MTAESAAGDTATFLQVANSICFMPARDDWADERRLTAWLRERHLVPGGYRATTADLRAARRFREAVRHLMAVNQGEPPQERDLDVVNSVLRRGELAVTVDGSARLEVVTTVRAGVAPRWPLDVAAAMARAVQDGSWERYKLCRNPDCRWGFYDASNNRSGRWCDMAVCGNRAKIGAYRSRATTRPPTASTGRSGVSTTASPIRP